MHAPNPHSHALVHKLESITTLSDDERKALIRLPMMVRDLKTDQDIVREGDRPSQCCLIIEGFVCRYKIVENGKRQILSFHVAGDIPDLQSLHIDVMDHSLATIAASKVGFLQHDAVRQLMRSHPRIGDAFWRDTLIDAAIFREWMVGIGRREAYSRVAHLLCELLVKFRAVGLSHDHSCELPLTQSELGDALGISTVHANRVIQQLRADGLITWFGRNMVVQDWEGLKKAGGFDPSYLHLKEAAVAA